MTAPAERLRRRLGETFALAFADLDVVISPTMPLTAWEVGTQAVEIAGRSESVLAASWRLTYPWNLLRIPAISLPCGYDRNGLPIGVQISATALDEAAMFRAAAALEGLLGGPMPRCA